MQSNLLCYVRQGQHQSSFLEEGQRAGGSAICDVLVNVRTSKQEQRGLTLLRVLSSWTLSSLICQIFRKSPVEAIRSGLLHSLSGMNMILVGGNGWLNVRLGSEMNLPFSSSTAQNNN